MNTTLQKQCTAKVQQILLKNIQKKGEMIMASSLVQVRVDNELKREAIELFDKLGLDISTAIRVFLARAVRDGGIPFSMVLEEKAEVVEAIEVTEDNE